METQINQEMEEMQNMSYETLKSQADKILAEIHQKLALCNDTYRLCNILGDSVRSLNYLWLEAELMVQELEGKLP